MDEKDREIIQMLQGRFPLDSEPFRVIGDKLWLDEVSVISRIARMIQSGAIRYVGPFFDSRKLGYKGTLAAIEVKEEDVERVSGVINEFPEITHNYLRKGHPNMWFTVIARTKERKKEIFEQIKTKTGVDEVLQFPAKKLFKVKVDLD
jgi:DNA-binding Lrp family transcriptional regulator